ncbi:hypothetical protein FA95DRAFT_1560072 [Auriscalpium vulgare]|uniref:Uncharacterized protein n=1 Tax=Auriscalpium vulgare TaxID=40419 RepID=A0ACB8RQS5_9AGAM|nr:hypothetical protein FA95DRAFT_1560072 [Auriscalpium vulgare]
MRDFYTICNPGPGVPENPPEPKSEPKPEPIVRDPNPGLTPAEAERLEWFKEGTRSGKLFDEMGWLVSEVGGKDHYEEYFALLAKRSAGKVKQQYAILKEAEPRFIQLAFDRAECQRMFLECWEIIADIEEQRRRAEGTS